MGGDGWYDSRSFGSSCRNLDGVLAAVNRDSQCIRKFGIAAAQKIIPAVHVEYGV